MAGTVFEFGAFRFDAGARVLWRGRDIVGVAPKALDLLAVLLERAGDVVTKDELLRRAWPDAVVEEANLSVNVSLLRKALGDAPGGAPWIETIPRRGYRFAGPVRAASATPRAVAVLPFRALRAGDGDEALGLAMADAVITRLARTGEITVRPTSAVQRYATGEADPRAAGRALGVDVVLDSRLQREGSRLRVTAQLLSVASDAPLWAESFDEEMS
ncbi:MAG TPA: winged helix-turn-helix domain-containing protein, partial [Vicinamibacteria bacterium]|nr:winged helix-turn-helix domain-containing protein [Vicinamibacteria bacterium]